MVSNTERGKAFQIRCAAALAAVFGRRFDLEVPLHIGGGKTHAFDIASTERDIVAECKAFSFTASGNNPSAKITTLRGSSYVSDPLRRVTHKIAYIKYAPHPVRGETLGRYFVRLNPQFLDGLVVLEMPEQGGELVCIRGTLKPLSQ